MIANAFGAIAYIAMAVAVNEMFAATESSVLGQRRRVLLAALAAGALVQLLLGLAAYFNFPSVVPGLQMAAAVCLVSIPLNFWPVVARIKARRLRVLLSLIHI